MQTADIAPILRRLFSELIDGANEPGGGLILNSGDVGLLRSLDLLSAADASRAVHDGATIAAHVRHLADGLSLMNRWADTGGNPFADPTWDDAWKTAAVDAAEWSRLRTALRGETGRWLRALGSPRQATDVELAGMVASVAHVAYHVGALRQIGKELRGPRQGTF